MTLAARPLLVLPAAVLLAACSGSKDGGTGVAVITVAPATAALCIGDTLTLRARVVDASGDTVPGSAVRWASSAPSSVSIDSVTGLARALALGTAQITATAGGLRSATPGQVEVPSDLLPEFVPDTLVLAPGDTFTLGVRLRRASTGLVPVRTPVIAALDTAPASITTSGLVTAKAVGTAGFSLGTCGFTGHGAARVFTPPDSATGLGYLWLSGPAELRVSFGALALNFTLSTKKPAWQVASSLGSTSKQFVYEDTVRLTGAGPYPVDSLASSEATPTLPCQPPRPFAAYGDQSSLTSILSMHGGSAGVTTFTSKGAWFAIAGRVRIQMRGFFGGVTKLDTLQAIYTFSAPLRDSTNACP